MSGNFNPATLKKACFLRNFAMPGKFSRCSHPVAFGLGAKLTGFFEQKN
jgi:hypothetical protein